MELNIKEEIYNFLKENLKIKLNCKWPNGFEVKLILKNPLNGEEEVIDYDGDSCQD